ncbi:MAG: spermidine synthase, partial [Candidatus Binatia bacterium]
FVTAIVVLPMAVVSGYQLPLLIALIGSRTEDVGADVGSVYGYNTAGAIFGSLAGGFGMIPGLGALGTWRTITASLVALAVAGAAIAWKRREPVHPGILALAAGVAALALSMATGPTALWRHTPIGAGLTAGFGTTPNEMRSFIHDVRRGVYWEEDGVESSVAVTDTDSFSLMMNGKSDGNAIADASTMIMTGVLPAIVHDGPKRALVIGLGLGTSAGWLARVPSIEHVDVVELEPSVLRAARDAAAVNEGVMDNPKVRFVLGDAREYLLTTSERYDIIASEPSNPYRAGVASLFTVEYYEAAKRALAADGVFAQWVQTYAVGDATVKTVYATLASVFDSVESWEVQLGTDLLLLARNSAAPHDIGQLRARTDSEPFRSALREAWGLSGIDGLFAGYVAGPPMARAIRAATPTERLNTDDSTVIEFEFARSLGRSDNQILGMIRAASQRRPEFAPTLTGGAIDWAAVEELRPARSLQEEKAFNAEGFSGSDEALARVHARVSYASGRFDQVRLVWAQQPREPVHPIDVLLAAESWAEGGDDKCLALAERLREWTEADAEAVLARYHEKTGDLALATVHLERYFAARRTSAWGYRPLLRRTLATAWRVAEARRESVAPLLAALGQPFAAHVAEDRRVFARASIALEWGPPESCAQYLEPSEPWIPFDRPLLTRRAECYRRVGSRFAAQAQRDLDDFEASAPPVAFEPGSR